MVKRHRRRDKRNRRGFTLIEIVLVLAIAGLILVIVFLAVSGAQRARRDSQRKSDIAKVLAAVNNYASNNNGNAPTTLTDWNAFIDTYITRANLYDPLSGQAYDLPYRPWDSAPHSDEPSVGQIFVQAGHACNAGNNTDGTSNPIAGNDTNPKRFAVWGGLENGGYLCVDNN
jgi:prepilin-type N-terminal cleavage/methylation domain-containing protein